MNADTLQITVPYWFIYLGIMIVTLILIGKPIVNSILRNRYNNSDLDNTRLEQIEKIMKEPKNIEISNYEERIRRNLLAISFIAIACTYLNIQIDPNSKFFGVIQFSDLKPKIIYVLMLLILLYEFIHYFWHIYNNWSHWRVRLTGISHPEVRGGGEGGQMGGTNSPNDYWGEDKNSNFYVWMFENQHDRKGAMKNLIQKSESFSDALRKLDIEGTPIDSKALNALKDSSNALTLQAENLTTAINNVRVDASLLRFDQWFRLLIKSQNIRWFLLDVSLPLTLGIIAIASLTHSLLK